VKTSIIMIVVMAVVAVVVVGVVGSLAVSVGQSSRQVTLPSPTGPYRVGRTLVYWTDETRVDPFAPNRSTHRELPVLIWYPANPRPHAKPTSYLPPGWSSLLHSGPLATILRTPPANIHPHAVENAPIQPGGRRFPLLVFEPALGLAPTDYTVLIEDLASHGFVVAGIDPTYTNDVVLPGNRVVSSVPDARDTASYSQVVGVWAADSRFVAQRLARLDSSAGSRFYRRLEIHHIGFVGDAAGGAAAALACRGDRACGGAADIDGDLTGNVLSRGLGRPFLFLADASAFSNEPYLKGMIRRVVRDVPRSRAFAFTLEDARPASFSDRKLYFSAIGALLGGGTADPIRPLRITETYLQAFFGVAWGGREPAVLRRPHSPYPEVKQVPISG